MPKDLATPEDLLSAVDAAKILGLSADMVRILAREGRLPAAAQTTRGLRLFRRSEVEQLASERAGLVHSSHAVQFYDSKDFLSGFVASFVAAALRARAPVVIIARSSLRKTFVESNGGLGFDLDAARDSGQLGLYDAAEVLATFMVSGRPDRSLFRDSIGAMVRKATASRPRMRLRIYGEMVDVLWSEGHHEAAVELEELWNDLAREHSFSLLCAYDMGNFGHAGQEEQFESICRAHTSVTPAESFRAGAVEVERHRQIARMQQRATALEGLVERRQRDDGTAMHDFLGALGRELRAPLAAIKTAVETMRERAIADEEQRALEQQVGSALRVVDELVDYSRVARGEIVLRRERVEVAGLIARAAESIASLLAERGVRLDIRVPAGLAVEVDPDRMVQAFNQLLAGAARRSGPGAAIVIEAAGGASSVRISVKDEGDGIAFVPADRIFDPLAGGAGRPGNVGFGLAIARDLVRLHGGSVVVTSGPGRGSELTVSLHEASLMAARDGDDRAATPPRPRRDSGGGPGGRRRILIVDDNEDLASLMSELLQVHGHTVETAHEGRAALDLAATFEPEIALLDIGLPGMDGYELAREMRKLRQGSIRLIAITGYAQETDRHRSLEAGFSGHLVKPVDPATLARLIEDA
jgi:signal transduction histidine kinase